MGNWYEGGGGVVLVCFVHDVLIALSCLRCVTVLAKRYGRTLRGPIPSLVFAFFHFATMAWAFQRRFELSLTFCFSQSIARDGRWRAPVWDWAESR